MQFFLPLGTTVNMNGTALYEAVTVIFIAQVRQPPDSCLVRRLSRTARNLPLYTASNDRHS